MSSDRRSESKAAATTPSRERRRGNKNPRSTPQGAVGLRVLSAVCGLLPDHVFIVTTTGKNPVFVLRFVKRIRRGQGILQLENPWVPFVRPSRHPIKKQVNGPVDSPCDQTKILHSSFLELPTYLIHNYDPTLSSTSERRLSVSVFTMGVSGRSANGQVLLQTP
ncbi:hypothetical protein BHM03_00057916 [Ensete ventricosum]|nr:hypothetical protein BHM03_00057916 [Ensete ventricosum]